MGLPPDIYFAVYLHLYIIHRVTLNVIQDPSFNNNTTTCKPVFFFNNMHKDYHSPHTHTYIHTYDNKRKHIIDIRKTKIFSCECKQ